MNAYHVPGMRHGLLSTSSLCDIGLTTVFKKNECVIRDEETEDFTLKPTKKGGLYILESKDLIPTAYVAYGEAVAKASLDVWHQRLGHVSKTKILNVMDKMPGLELNTDIEDIKVCDGCQLGKQTRDPFGKAIRKNNPLELIHSDLCGEFQDISLGGAKYFILFIDDCTRFTYVEFLKNKNSSTICSAFKKFKAWAELKTGFKVKGLRTDGGSEYLGELRTFLEQEGIEHETTTRYSPQSNGMAERMNRTLLDMARPMIYGSNAPKSLWAEAVNTAVYLFNLLPNKNLDFKTPSEKLLGETPDVSHLRMFGSIVYSKVPDEIRRKLDPKSIRGILIGYGATQSFYKIYEPQRRVVYMTRDVYIPEVFDAELAKGMWRSYEPGEPYHYIDPNQVEEMAEVVIQTPIQIPIPPPPIIEELPIIDEPLIIEQPIIEPVVEQVAEEVIQPEVIAIPPRTEPIPQVQQVVEPEPLRRSSRNVKPPDRYEGNKAEIVLEPQSYTDAISGEDSVKWRAAMEEEMNAMHTNNVWTLVQPPSNSPNVVSTKWVFKIKENDTYKARFIARGFSQAYGQDYDETFAPVAKYSTIRALLSYAAGNKLKIHQMDVTTAFLNGVLNELVYISQPEGFEKKGKENWICCLNKALYGLKQSPRAWYENIKPKLKQMGFEECGTDNSIFVSKGFGETPVHIILYVDDLLIIAKGDEEISEIKERLKQSYKMKDLGVARKFLGFYIEYHVDGIFIHQEEYIKSLLAKHGMENAHSVTTPLDSNVKLILDNGEETVDQKQYQSIVGGLMYAACVTRIDIAYAVGLLSRFSSKPTVSHLAAAKRVLRYLNGTVKAGIKYSKEKDLELYSDADFAGDLTTRKSTTGYVAIMNSGAIVWRSCLQSTVSTSTTESEYMALSDAVKELKYLSQFIQEAYLMENQSLEPIFVGTDNQGALSLGKNPIHHQRTKHIDIRYHTLRNAVSEGLIDLNYVNTDDMPADFLTKALPKEKHRRCMDLTGMRS